MSCWQHTISFQDSSKVLLFNHPMFSLDCAKKGYKFLTKDHKIFDTSLYDIAAHPQAVPLKPEDNQHYLAIPKQYCPKQGTKYIGINAAVILDHCNDNIIDISYTPVDAKGVISACFYAPRNNISDISFNISSTTATLVVITLKPGDTHNYQIPYCHENIDYQITFETKGQLDQTSKTTLKMPCNSTPSIPPTPAPVCHTCTSLVVCKQLNSTEIGKNKDNCKFYAEEGPPNTYYGCIKNTSSSTQFCKKGTTKCPCIPINQSCKTEGSDSECCQSKTNPVKCIDLSCQIKF